MVDNHICQGTNRDPRKNGEISKSLCFQSVDPRWSELDLEAANLRLNSLFCIYFPISLGEVPSGRGLLLQKLKLQAEFPLIISLSIAGAISLKAMGKVQAKIKLESEREQAFHSVTYLYIRYFFKYIFSPAK